MLGQIILNMGDPAGAASHLHSAVAAEPGFLPARASLGLALLQAGESGQAIEHLEAALPTDEDGSLHFRLATAYRNSGKQDLAKVTLAKYQEIRKSLEASSLAGEEEDRQITPP